MSSAAKIMVVDDSPAIVDSIEMMLDFEGFEVSKFYKGSLDSGADEFIAKPFDLGNMVERIRHYIK